MGRLLEQARGEERAGRVGDILGHPHARVTVAPVHGRLPGPSGDHPSGSPFSQLGELPRNGLTWEELTIHSDTQRHSCLTQ